MSISFFVNYAQMEPEPLSLAKGFLPLMATYAATQAVGILGAVIMPHNLFLHSALVLSREINNKNKMEVREANRYFSYEAAVALGVSFFINLAVVAVFAKGFFDPECAVDGKARIDPAGDCVQIGLFEAGDALRTSLGDAATTVWAVGLLAAGQSSTMTGTYAGQFVMEGFLQLRLPAWQRVAFTRTIALLPAVMVALTTEPGSVAADTLGEWLNILQSVQLPFALLPLLHFSTSRRIMGSFAISGTESAITWFLALAVMVVNTVFMIDFMTGSSGDEGTIANQLWFQIVVGVLGIGYFALVFYIVHFDVLLFWDYLKTSLYDTGTVEKEPLVSAGLSVRDSAGLNQDDLMDEDEKFQDSGTDQRVQ